MSKVIAVTVTDAEHALIEETRANAANRGDDLGTESQLARHALLTWLDFYTRMNARELDGSPSADVLIRKVPGVLTVREREMA